MKIAIIGGGIAGLATSWMLQNNHDVTLYERGTTLGGHARTKKVTVGNTIVPVDVGFRYLFPESCGHVFALLRLLNVKVAQRRASLHFEGIESKLRISLPPRSTQSAWRILTSPKSIRYITHYARFLMGRHAIFKSTGARKSLDSYALAEKFPADFRRELLYPFLGASWGMTHDDIPDVSAYSILKVMQPESKFFIVVDGVSTYIQQLVSRLSKTKTLVNTKVLGLHRRGSQIEVNDSNGDAVLYDAVVLATESSAAATITQGLAGAESMAKVLSRFRCCDDYIVVHSDRDLMPADERDWSVVNVRHQGQRAVLTEWTGLDQKAPVFRSFSAREPVVAKHTHWVESFKHPIVTPEHYAIQDELSKLQGTNGVWAAGLYTRDVDNHESALVSAMTVARQLAPSSPNLRALVNEQASTSPLSRKTSKSTWIRQLVEL